MGLTLFLTKTVQNQQQGRGKRMVHAYATDGKRIWSFQGHRDRDEWVAESPEVRRKLTEGERRAHYNLIRRRRRDEGAGAVGVV